MKDSFEKWNSCLFLGMSTFLGRNFGLLLPIVMLLRPQVEAHLKKECILMTARDNTELIQIMDQPCAALARPIADCLVKEAEGSGRLIGVVADIIKKKYGSASEHVTKRCITKTLNMPKDSLDRVPLSVLIENMQSSSIQDKKKDESERYPRTPPIR